MPTLTTSDLDYIKRKLGSFAASFTDPELQAYADDAYLENTETYLKGAVANAFYALATQAVNLVDFRQGETSENQKVIYDRLWKLYTEWATQAGHLGGVPIVPIEPVRQYMVYLPFDEDTE